MRRRLRGKQPPLGMTAFARVVHAKAILAKAIADRAKALADQAKAAETEALVAAAEAEARAQAAETACQQADGLAERARQWTAAEARKTSQADKDRWSAFARNCGPSPRRRKTGPAARLQPPSDRVLPLGCNIPNRDLTAGPLGP